MPMVREGAAEISAPRLGPSRGPASSDVAVFYNPAMAPCRDLSVLAVQGMARLLPRGLRVLDGLSGTGVRAIRLALETETTFEALVANDRSPEAFELLAENVRRNGLEGVVGASRRDLNALLSECRFDIIDIDPFGSPVGFIPAGIGAVRHGGMLAVTATDTGPLCGTNPRTCLRRYGALSMRSEHMHETAARILVGHCVRQGASRDIALRPILVHSDDHYLRVYLRAFRSVSRANACLEELGYLGPGRRLSGLEGTGPVPGSIAGPLWLGELMDRGFAEAAWKDLNDRLSRPEAPPFARPKQLVRTVELLREEAGMPPFFHELDAVAQRARLDPPRLADMIGTLRDRGFKASRTHFCPTGFRTDAPEEELLAAFREASTRRE